VVPNFALVQAFPEQDGERPARSFPSIHPLHVERGERSKEVARDALERAVLATPGESLFVVLAKVSWCVGGVSRRLSGKPSLMFPRLARLTSPAKGDNFGFI